MINLQPKSLTILKTCLEHHAPELLEVAFNTKCNNYSDKEYNLFRDIVGTELMIYGFDDNWNPTSYGWELENLIDEIGRLMKWE